MSSSSCDSSVESTRNKRPRMEYKTVGQYNIILTLGEGKFAKVMLAEHVSTGEEVAIKRIDKTPFRTGGLEILFREAEIMNRLNHPNIIKLKQVFDTQKHLYLIMEYAPGGDLLNYMDECGRLSEDKARHIFRQVVSAVDYCHRKGIIHRDIKDENILLDNNSNIKIADFGLSNIFSPENKLRTYCGTIGNMAPEIIQGKEYGPEVDIWCLGTLLYFLLTNTRPFDGPTSQDIAKQVLRCSYEIPDFVSTECKVLIRKMLVFEPELRTTLKLIMSDKWINDGYEDELKPYVESEEDVRDQ